MKYTIREKNDGIATIDFADGAAIKLANPIT